METNDESNNKPYIDRFGMWLACRLLGDECLRYLTTTQSSSIDETTTGNTINSHHTTTNRSFHLYWRTPLLLLLAKLNHENDIINTVVTSDEENKVVFIDICFDFIGSSQSKPQPSVEVRFGALIVHKEQQQQPHGVYIRSRSPLTFPNLQTHAERIGLDLTETSPNAMANLMANALQQSTNRSTSSVSVVGFDLRQHQTTTILLEYSELHETGEIPLLDHSRHDIDFVVLSMILSNCTLKKVIAVEEEEEEGTIWNWYRQLDDWYTMNMMPTTIVTPSSFSEPTLTESMPNSEQQQQQRTLSSSRLILSSSSNVLGGSPSNHPISISCPPDSLLPPQNQSQNDQTPTQQHVVNSRLSQSETNPKSLQKDDEDDEQTTRSSNIIPKKRWLPPLVLVRSASIGKRGRVTIGKL